MKTKLIGTNDGSFTLTNEYFGETYHSINGAVSESVHIFINLGLRNFKNSEINILEIGYGTGLNAMLTYIENIQLGNVIKYHSIEKYPIDEADFMEYATQTVQISDKIKGKTLKDFCTGWNKEIKISDNFKLYKQVVDFNEFIPCNNYNIIYFDAFSPETQPEMWSEENLRKITDRLVPEGFFVTYCSKGIVKQALRNLGLTVRRMPGPAGKRHVLQAQKNCQCNIL